MVHVSPLPKEPMLTSKPLSFCKPDPNQPRKHFAEELLLALGASLKVRQNDPIQCKPDGTIIDGERRWRAAKLVGLEKLDVIITETPLTDKEISLHRLTSFFHREGLSPWEKFQACQQLLELNQWQGKDLAAHLHVDPATITRLLSPARTIPAWQEALKAGKVGLSDVYAASKLPEESQAGLLALKLSGATRDQLEAAGRKQRTPKPADVKVSRVKITLPKATVVVTGNELAMPELCELLSDALKESRKAAETYDVSTFQRMMADKSKKAS